MVNLGVCYYFYETKEYDINFTTPHCLLVLRMIGFGFDFLDGVKPRGPLSKDQTEAALSEMPSFLELCGFAFMTPSFLVGPLFGFKKYQQFIRGEFDDKGGYLMASYKSFYYGCIYVAVRQVALLVMPMIFFLSPCLRCASFLNKIVFICLLGKIFLWKYAAVWLLSESALIAYGIAWGPTDQGVVSDWAGCRNVNIRLFDLQGVRLDSYIKSINIQTNKWAADYIFKRLKFLKSKLLSFAVTAVFLAVWHGFHSGYYLTFALEFLVINFEKEFERVFNRVIGSRMSSSSTVLSIASYLFLRIYNILLFGICVIPFAFLNYEDWSFVYSSISDVLIFVAYGYGIALVLWIAMLPLTHFV